VSEPLEMQPWVRSWGAQVEVLAPQGLRERIADDLRRAAGQYTGQYEPEPVTPVTVMTSAPELNVQPVGAARFWPFALFHEA